jgi:hypothetical protein
MDFMDTINEWAKKISDKTNEVVEIAKLRAANFSKNEKANELKKEIGEICFSMYRSGDELDPGIENLCAEIKKLKSEMAENERTIRRMKEAAGDTVDMAASGFCPLWQGFFMSDVWNHSVCWSWLQQGRYLANAPDVQREPRPALNLY